MSCDLAQDASAAKCFIDKVLLRGRHALDRNNPCIKPSTEPSCCPATKSAPRHLHFSQFLTDVQDVWVFSELGLHPFSSGPRVKSLL